MADNIRITVNELRKRMDAGDQFVFIDARNPQAWGESDMKLPGAIRVPADQLDQHLAEIPRNKPLVAYCT